MHSKNKEKIAIFGTGSLGKRVYDFFKDSDIVAFFDNDKNKHNKIFMGKKIYAPSQISKFTFDKIIIASGHEEEIYNQLISLDVDKKKILKSIYHLESTSPFTDNNYYDVAKEIMLWICDLFNQNNISYHIDHGTLLGIIRDKKLLPWDNDIDFALLEEERSSIEELIKINIPNFKSKYCKVNNWKYFVSDIKDMKINNTNIKAPVSILIVNHEKENNNIFDLGQFVAEIKFKYIIENKIYWQVSEKFLSCDKDMCFPAIDHIFEGHTIKIPVKSEEYLQLVYGKNWKTPIKTWNYSQYGNIED